ncbi:MAG TPA: hypothetical protein VFR34_15250 [Paracoccaceae bacterium]|nr:hypothetical protein [Paracoccaceae bacterium]
MAMTGTGEELAKRRASSGRAVVRRPSRRVPPASAEAVLAALPRWSEVQALRARMRPRHWLVLLSFLALVVAPAAAINAYLHLRAADQYVSAAEMTVASDDFMASTGMFADLFLPETGEASDTDILYSYIFSQDMVVKVDARLDLRRLWRKRAAEDPVLSLGEDPSIEALVGFWHWMVDVIYEPRQGIIGLEVRAFEAEDARAIAQAIVEESRILINRLSEAAREDAVRFARADLEEARARLEAERARVRAFRDENRIILPDAEVAGQTGLLNVLQSMLAETVISRTQLLDTTRQGDPRLGRAERRVKAITEQIAAERRRLATEEAGLAEATIAARLSRFEELRIDLEFAEQAYLKAQAAHDAARAEAHRLSRYVNVHVQPTLAESARYPDRITLGVLVTLMFVVSWLILVLIAYNIRDSR